MAVIMKPSMRDVTSVILEVLKTSKIAEKIIFVKYQTKIVLLFTMAFRFSLFCISTYMYIKPSRFTKVYTCIPCSLITSKSTVGLRYKVMNKRYTMPKMSVYIPRIL
jgi:hypothetical protein